MKQSHSKVGQIEIPGLGTADVNIVMEVDCEEGQEDETDAKLSSFIDGKFAQLGFVG